MDRWCLECGSEAIRFRGETPRRTLPDGTLQKNGDHLVYYCDRCGKKSYYRHNQKGSITHSMRQRAIALDITV